MSLSRSSNPFPDPLFEIVIAAGAGTARRTRLEASGSWALAFPPLRRLKFVALLEGHAWLLVPERAPSPLGPGDVFLLGETPYAVASDPGIEPTDGTPLYKEPGVDLARIGDGGGDTIMIGGSIVLADQQIMLRALPSFLPIKGADPSAEAIRRTLGLLDSEADNQRPGGALVMARLAEMLLVEAVRTSMTAGAPEAGLIAAFADRQIGSALQLMHGDVSHRWTVAALAAEVGMSRSAFAARFAHLVGQSPLDYLKRRRMLMARQLLNDDRRSVESVALTVGYDSQSAFGHAYRSIFGHSPRGRAARPVGS
ncbi:AraC family transcriptional regulator [Mangrovicella endophytica]|uniref:AraC family transcriptional regulator n=1 Tax=Mangrovicella endophytica TaxID=2066697 RepID=UPI000C9DAE19|nr:AraC family transcriptional regulator [Mangrovicella endophytica]